MANPAFPHAWFTVFARLTIEIMLTVLVEEGGQGSDVADLLRGIFLRLILRGGSNILQIFFSQFNDFF